MSGPTNSSYLHAVAEVATLAGDFAMSHYRTTLNVLTKGDGSPVTVADRGAEERARAWIESRFPDDGIVGEEYGTIRPDARRRWFVDPIDGTKSFVRSVPLWGTLIAVTEGDQVIAGCAYFPAAGEIVTAALDEGCFWNDVRCRVSEVDELSLATVVTTDDRFPERPARQEAWKQLGAHSGVVRTWGDCYGYLLVATGRAEVMVDDIVSPWDAVALQPIITEAGGVLTDWNGDETAFGKDLIATNAKLSAEVRSILMKSNSVTYQGQSL